MYFFILFLVFLVFFFAFFAFFLVPPYPLPFAWGHPTIVTPPRQPGNPRLPGTIHTYSRLRLSAVDTAESVEVEMRSFCPTAARSTHISGVRFIEEKPCVRMTVGPTVSMSLGFQDESAFRWRKFNSYPTIWYVTTTLQNVHGRMYMAEAFFLFNYFTKFAYCSLIIIITVNYYYYNIL